MDAGVAAVLGATVATAGPVATAIVTHTTTRRQGQVDHGHWLRDQRQQAYVDALDKNAELTRLFGVQQDAGESQEARAKATADAEKALQDLRAALLRVKVAGPKSVSNSANTLEYRAEECLRAMWDQGGEFSMVVTISKRLRQYKDTTNSFAADLREAHEAPPWNDPDRIPIRKLIRAFFWQ